MHRLPLLRLDRGKLDAVEAIAFGLSLVLALALALSCWYQSLTADRVQEFEARCLAERAMRAR